MPRQSRIDFPGALHHIMVRGIERCIIFDDIKDRRSFLERLGETLSSTQTSCYAYALMSNHFHLLLETGETSISRVMQSLLTGYAVNYNIRHKRSGKLYQNRFKSILCDKEDYFCELIRYIHLNPIRGGVLKNLSELDRSPWTGHAVLMGRKKAEWYDTEEVLSHFGMSKRDSRQAYREYVQAGLNEDEEERVDMNGGGLIRSLGGVWEVIKLSKQGKKEAGDERILGSGAFVEASLKRTEERESRASRLCREGWGFDRVLRRAAEVVGLPPDELRRRGRSNARSVGRALLCKWLIDDLGECRSSVSESLGITGPSVSILSQRGRELEKEMGTGLV